MFPKIFMFKLDQTSKNEKLTIEIKVVNIVGIIPKTIKQN
jgi:hypothetical protein